MDDFIGLTSPLPWALDQDNAQGLRVVDARGETVYEEDWGGIPDEMSSATREAIVTRARANARFMVQASEEAYRANPANCQHKNSECVYESDDGEFERWRCKDCGERWGVEIAQ